MAIVLGVMPYACIDADVDMAEEAELRRLGRCCGSPSAPALGDGLLRSLGIGLSLAHMNAEAGAAKEHADAAAQPVQWQ